MDTLDLIHPTLRPLVNAFLMKSKYPYKIESAGRTTNVPDSEGQWKMYSLRVNFFDPNYTHTAVGSLRLIVKSDGGLTYGVTGRKEVAPRRRNLEDRFSKTSTDEKKVLKMMCQMIVPYTLREISGFYEKSVVEALKPWRAELLAKTRAPYQKLTYHTMVKELRNLQSLGVSFVTSEFRDMVEETLAYHDEHEYRTNVPVVKMFVSIREDGIHTTMDGALVVYPTFDMLPKDLQGKLAILKMLKDGDNIPEVGVRIDSNTFWLLIMPERVDAGNQ